MNPRSYFLIAIVALSQFPTFVTPLLVDLGVDACANNASLTIILLQQFLVHFPIAISDYFSSNVVININHFGPFTISNAPTYVATTLTGSSISTSTVTALSTVTTTTAVHLPLISPTSYSSRRESSSSDRSSSLSMTETSQTIPLTPIPSESSETLVILISPSSNQRRQVNNVPLYVGQNGSATTSAKNSNVYALLGGQLLDLSHQQYVSADAGETTAPMIGQRKTITQTFTLVNGVLAWKNTAFSGGAAIFYYDPNNLQVIAALGTTNLDGFIQVTLNLVPQPGFSNIEHFAEFIKFCNKQTTTSRSTKTSSSSTTSTSSSCSAIPTIVGDVVKNGGFECGLSPWVATATIDVKIDDNSIDAFEGSKSLQVYSPTNLTQGVSGIEPSVLYTLTFFASTNGGGCYVAALLDQDPARNLTSPVNLVADGQYRRYTTTFNYAAAGVTTAALSFDSTNCKTQFSLDSVSLSPNTCDTSNLLGDVVKNGGFECGFLYPWTNAKGGALVQKSDPNTGTYSLFIKTTDSPTVDQVFTVIPQQDYVLTFSAHATLKDVGLIFLVSESDALSPYFFPLTNNYDEYKVFYKGTDNGVTSFSLSVQGNPSSGDITIDSISLTASPLCHYATFNGDLVVNGGFECAVSPWSLPYESVLVYKPAEVYQGTYALKFVAGSLIYQQVANTVPSQSYTLAFMASTSSDNCILEPHFGDNINGDIIVEKGLGYQRYTTVFPGIDSPGVTVEILIYSFDCPGGHFLDSITLTPSVCPANMVPGDLISNGGFECGVLSPWTLTYTSSPPYARRLVSDAVHSGTVALYVGVGNSNPNPTVLSQIVTVSKLTPYTLRFWASFRYSFFSCTFLVSSPDAVSNAAPIIVNDNTFRQYTVLFGGSLTSRLEIVFTTQDCKIGFLIDDVTLTPT
ncbi:hypothetical protein PVAG01_01972 [Phlyctema vagabunda]|uniref:Uncharacterized protein n=1 Tax=Phlyctema vagabunda TaxID=108571 RepID=A0ABR4PYP3_9HELO